MSGLSYGVVVVEAARRSGSLITARFALEQGREVFAVPGSPLDPRAEGTNDLIRAGATLCSSVDHVTAVLDPLIANPPLDRRAEETAEHEVTEPLWDELDLPELEGLAPAPVRATSRMTDPVPEPEPRSHALSVADLLGPSPIAVDDLVRQSGLPIRVVQMTLLELEIAGRLERHGGNLVSLIANR